METPEALTLSEQKQKSTLSAKKNKKKDKRVRTMFASPYNPYWPVVEEDDAAEVNQLLSSALEPAKKAVIKVNWSELKKLPCAQRREARRKQQGESPELRKSLLLGVNAVTRGLETTTVGCVLLAQDADPRVLVSHIPTMCGMQGVPVLVLPDLRTISNISLGFSCLALGIKKYALFSDSSHFHSLFNVVSTLSKKIPLPEPLPLFHHAMTHDSDEEEEEEEEKTQPPVNAKAMQISQDVYLYRTSKKERVFVPGKDTMAKEGDIIPRKASSSQVSMDFISLDEDNSTPASLILCVDKTSNVDKKKSALPVNGVVGNNPVVNKRKMQHPELHYQPLRMKQLFPNPKKVRRKELQKQKK
ncbi:uncharacterized protein [Periplaneta americana]|uniref:uncharacterized protein n=1 Tax=Periplaneta americana TaxID=6978 RepID=UPI0037E74D86